MSNAFLLITFIVGCVLITQTNASLDAEIGSETKTLEGTVEEDLLDINTITMDSGSFGVINSLLTSVRHRNRRDEQSTDHISSLHSMRNLLKLDLPATSHEGHNNHIGSNNADAIIRNHSPEKYMVTTGPRHGLDTEQVETQGGMQLGSTKYQRLTADIQSDGSPEIHANGQREALSGSLLSKLGKIPSGEESIEHRSGGHVSFLKHPYRDELQHDVTRGTHGKTHHMSLPLADVNKDTGVNVGHTPTARTIESKPHFIPPHAGVGGHLSLESSDPPQSTLTSTQDWSHRRTPVKVAEGVHHDNTDITAEFLKMLIRLQAVASENKTNFSTGGSAHEHLGGHSMAQSSLHEMILRHNSRDPIQVNAKTARDFTDIPSVQRSREPKPSTGELPLLDLVKSLSAGIAASSMNKGNGMTENGNVVPNSTEFIYVMLPKSEDILKYINWSGLVPLMKTASNIMETAPSIFSNADHAVKTNSAAGLHTELNLGIKSHNASTHGGTECILLPAGSYGTTWSAAGTQQLPSLKMETVGGSSYVTLQTLPSGAIGGDGRILYKATPVRLMLPGTQQSPVRWTASPQMAYYTLLNGAQTAWRPTVSTQQRRRGGVTYTAMPAVVIPNQGLRNIAG